MIQSVDRAIRVLDRAPGRPPDEPVGAGRPARAGARRPPTASSAAWSSTAWSCRSAARAATSSGPPCSGSATSTSTPSSCRSKAIPWAEDLARRTGLAVRTGVLLIDDVVIIHHEPRPDGSRQMPEVGIVIPAHASALGKAMLAFLPEDEKRVLTSGELRSMTGETHHLARRAARAAGRGPVQRHRRRAGRGGARRELAGEPGLRLVRRGRRGHRRRDPVRWRRRRATRRATWSARPRGRSPASWARRRGPRARLATTERGTGRGAETRTPTARTALARRMATPGHGRGPLRMGKGL